jgi:hypothetical protein
MTEKPGRLKATGIRVSVTSAGSLLCGTAREKDVVRPGADYRVPSKQVKVSAPVFEHHCTKMGESV